MKPQKYLLDTSFIIDCGHEQAAGIMGPARRTMLGIDPRRAYVSPVTVAELLEGAVDREVTLRSIEKFRRQPIGEAVAHRCALNQQRSERRMGENDAWQAAIAVSSGHTLVGHDQAFKNRPWLDYLDYKKK